MQHHLLLGEDRHIRLDYPDSWDELTRKQAIFAGNLLYLLTKQEIDVDQFRKLMVDKFIRRDNRGNDKMKSMEDSMDMWANEGQLADTVNFFFKVTSPEEGKEGVDKYEILPSGTCNLIPGFWHGLRKYQGPGEILDGMCFAQFKDAMACSQKYMETNEDYWLTRLVATLYTGPKEQYQIEDVDRRSKRLKRLNKGIKYISFCYFMGCVHNLRTDGGGDGIEIDGTLCKLSLLFNSKQGEYSGTDDGIGLLGVLMTLAESGVFGSLKETANADLWDVLPRLYQLKVEAMEMERRYKSTKEE